MTNTPIRLYILEPKVEWVGDSLRVQTETHDLRPSRVDRDHEVGHVASSDVIIDFSLPDATDRLLKCMDGNSAALVSGVTGRTPAQETLIHDERTGDPSFLRPISALELPC